MASRLVPYRLWNAADLDSGASLTTEAIDCRFADPEYLMFRVTQGSGTPDVKIEVAISNDGTTFNEFTSQEPIIASTNTTYGSLNPQDYHSITVPGAPWIKLRVTDVAALDNNVIDADLWMREI